MSSLATAKAGDIVLLQGCCHNPTGADFSGDQWKNIADLCNQRGLIPFVDFAYQGLGHGIKGDVHGLDILLERIPEALVSVSCSKILVFTEKEREPYLFSHLTICKLTSQLQICFR